MTKRTVNRRQFNEAIATIAERLAYHIVPLFDLSAPSKPSLDGTGFFVAAGNRVFLVSAGHVLSKLKKGQRLGFYVETKISREIIEQPIVIPELIGAHGDDSIDIGVVELTAPPLPPYPAVSKQTLALNRLETIRNLREEDVFLAIGFPVSKSKINRHKREIASSPNCIYAGYEHGIQSSVSGRLWPHNLMLPFRKREIFDIDGNPLARREPRGMSGSPVFMLRDKNLESHNPLPLVGVLTECHIDKDVVVISNVETADLAIRALI